ncbi:MAG: N-acetyltransferase [Rhodospirillaceae bacterium]|nr:N-acetyltransferase [Rhodospirillaceae bacterium]
MAVTIRAMTTADAPAVTALFREYEQWLDAKQCFADFNTEMADLPGAYAVILVAERGGKIDGAVALKDQGNAACEMKRLYCREALRGHGAGEALARALVAAARERKFRTIVLDTLPRLSAAIGLYNKLGFLTETSTPTNVRMSLRLAE